MRSGGVEVDSARRSLFTRCHMAGLYFHIPFCRRICAYCDFFKSAEDIPWTLDGEYDPGAPLVEIGIEDNGVTMLL